MLEDGVAATLQRHERIRHPPSWARDRRSAIGTRRAILPAADHAGVRYGLVALSVAIFTPSLLARSSAGAALIGILCQLGAQPVNRPIVTS